MIDISIQKIKSKCPSCDYPFTVTLDQVAAEKIIKCKGCLKDIQFKDSRGSTKKGIKDINKSFKDLEKAFKKFGRK